MFRHQTTARRALPAAALALAFTFSGGLLVSTPGHSASAAEPRAAASLAGAAAAPAAGPQITTQHWRGLLSYARGSWSGVVPNLHGSLQLRPFGPLPTREYTDPFGAGAAKKYSYGSWTSPIVRTGYPIDEAVASWNATTPTGTFVETTFRGKLADGSWTKWYVLGRWASGDDFAAGDIHRTSLDGQGDDDATVYTDTFSARTGKEPVAYQSRVTLLKPLGSKTSPTLDGLSTMTSELLSKTAPPTSTFTLGRSVELDVPPYAQNIHRGEYPEFGGGGEVWCSPTSSSMVLGYWAKKNPKYGVPASELVGIDAPNGDPVVPYAAINTWDYTYEGSGNWPFNTAYTHRFGINSFVTRLRSLAEAEKFIAAGIPVITSQSWKLADMPEAGYASNGHLMVLIGFTAAGDPIMNDPAANSDADVRSVYTRHNFEKIWQQSTGGVVYVNVPPGTKLPANSPGLTRNW